MVTSIQVLISAAEAGLGVCSSSLPHLTGPGRQDTAGQHREEPLGLLQAGRCLQGAPCWEKTRQEAVQGRRRARPACASLHLSPWAFRQLPVKGTLREVCGYHLPSTKAVAAQESEVSRAPRTRRREPGELPVTARFTFISEGPCSTSPCRAFRVQPGRSKDEGPAHLPRERWHGQPWPPRRTVAEGAGRRF